ncbi:MAG: hypothetical protein PVG42_00180 [Lysobacterales bacterium]
MITMGLAAGLSADTGTSPDVRTLMTPEDFTASGLDKLSDAERKHLSQWVERYREGAVVGPEVKKRPSEMTEEEKAEVQKERDAVIVAKVIPAFTGWSGKTVFRLDNGQVWQQRTPGNLRYSGSDSAVTIRQNILGLFLMEHEATGRSVGVRRID